MNHKKKSLPAHGLQWRDLAAFPALLGRLVLRGILILFALQALVVVVLVIIDAWRKRYRPQGYVPRTHPDAIWIGRSRVQIYTYGENLYAAMLEAIRQARERIFFETFIWKNDPVGQQFKLELQRAAERGVAVYVMYDSFANLVVPRHFKRFKPGITVLR
ncbi:MAG: phospholipase D-like domain-containing protein, partial [Ktedonobacteraceae bacterium]